MGNRVMESLKLKSSEELLRELGCLVSRKGNSGDLSLSTTARMQVVGRQWLVSFSQVASDRTRRQPQAVLGKFRLDVRRNFFIENLSEVEKSVFPKLFKERLDVAPSAMF